jgi:hypothetical protein
MVVIVSGILGYSTDMTGMAEEGLKMEPGETVPFTNHTQS